MQGILGRGGQTELSIVQDLYHLQLVTDGALSSVIRPVTRKRNIALSVDLCIKGGHQTRKPADTLQGKARQPSSSSEDDDGD